MNKRIKEHAADCGEHFQLRHSNNELIPIHVY